MRAPLPSLALLFGVGAPLPAVAGATLGLEEVLEVVKSELDLVRQIEVEVRRHDLKRAVILCIAALHGEQWRLLRLGAAPRPTIAASAPCASMPTAPISMGKDTSFRQGPGQSPLQRAKYFREGNFRWTWNPL